MYSVQCTGYITVRTLYFLHYIGYTLYVCIRCVVYTTHLIHTYRVYPMYMIRWYILIVSRKLISNYPCLAYILHWTVYTVYRTSYTVYSGYPSKYLITAIAVDSHPSWIKAKLIPYKIPYLIAASSRGVNLDDFTWE